MNEKKLKIALQKSGRLNEDSIKLLKNCGIQFGNGVIYEYASGRACSREDVRIDHIAQLIATKLAQFHSVPIEFSGKPYVICLIRQFIQIINQNEDQRKGFCFSMN